MNISYHIDSCCCSDSVHPHRWQPTRLPGPWGSPGKNTGVGCHFLLQCMKVNSEREVAQSRPTVHDPMDYSLPGSSIHGMFQARFLHRQKIKEVSSSNVLWAGKMGLGAWWRLFTVRFQNKLMQLSCPSLCFQCGSWWKCSCPTLLGVLLHTVLALLVCDLPPSNFDSLPHSPSSFTFTWALIFALLSELPSSTSGSCFLFQHAMRMLPSSFI